MEENASAFLFNDLDDGANEETGAAHGHSEDEVRALVQCIPRSLSLENPCAELPIQSAIFGIQSISFIPLLAEEGLKHNVGGEGMRGGLLCEDSFYGCNLFEIMIQHCYIGDVGTGVMRRLRDMDLMKKEDIQEYNLLRLSYEHPSHERRFEFLVDWDLEVLKTSGSLTSSGGMTLLQDSVNCLADVESFLRVLKAGIRHFPQEFGFLFHENDDGATTYDEAYRKFGAQSASAAIEGSVGNLFELDTTTNLYPFMIAAREGCHSNNLDLIYYLMGKNVQVFEDVLEDSDALEGSDALDEDLHGNANELRVQLSGESALNRKRKLLTS